MSTRSPQVDAYIKNTAPFARPILKMIREAFHKGCPDLVEELKWNVPHFTYKGILGGMAAFKNHVSFGFWTRRLMKDPDGWLGDKATSSMCSTKIAALNDSPSQKSIAAYVKEAAALNEQGVKAPRRNARPMLKTPPDLTAVLKKNQKAAATFDNFSPSCKREYIEWIVEAKRPETRAKRLATTLEWLAKGKQRNWKYQDCGG